jgi:hypothetical protein
VPQNHRDGFLVCASKSSKLQFIGCGTKPTEGSRCDLFHVKGSLTRFFQYGLKTGGGATAGGARGIIAMVMSEAS